MKDLAAIVLFCFNRPNHLEKTINSLKKNFLSNNSKIYIFSDAPKIKDDFEKVYKVRNYIKNLSGFKKKKIIFRKKNYGLAKNIVSGIDYVLKKEKKIIVLEDDLITSKYFLKYMNINLKVFQKNKNVASIHGYIYPINKKNLNNNFFIRGADCWGWGTWRRSWKIYEKNTNKLINNIINRKQIKQFNFNNSKNYFEMLKKNLHKTEKSWAIQWYASAFLQNMLTLYPKYTFVKNIGLDGSGRNTRIKYNLNSNFQKNLKISPINTVKEDIIAKKRFEIYFQNNEKNIFQKIFIKLIHG